MIYIFTSKIDVVVVDVSLKVNSIKMSIERVFFFRSLQLMFEKFLSLKIKAFHSTGPL